MAFKDRINVNDRRFFVPCEKCGNHILKSQGYMEGPEGHFTFHVRCELCGFEFQHHLVTQQRRKEEMMDQAKNMLNPKNLAKITKKVQEQMGMDN